MSTIMRYNGDDYFLIQIITPHLKEAYENHMLHAYPI